MKSACRFFAAFLDVLISLVRSKQNKLFLEDCLDIKYGP